MDTIYVILCVVALGMIWFIAWTLQDIEKALQALAKQHEKEQEK